MRKLTAVALTTASLLPFAAPAFAQDAAEQGVSADAAGGTEIIVSARRRDESIQDVPLSVQAVTSEQLEELQIRQFTDVAKLVPGLTLEPRGFTTASSLRGVSFDGTASGSATSVEFYRNDAVITSNALFTAVYDIGQIEVLRGPQGTLRGRASPSGSITITTRRPNLSEVGGYVSGQVAERSKWNFEGAVNVPVIADKLGIRVAGFVGSNRGNNIRGLNVPTGTIDDDIFRKTEALRASVRADPFDGVLVLDFNFETIAFRARQYGQSQSGSEINGSALSPRTIRVSDDLGAGSVPPTQDLRYKIYNWQAKFRQWGQVLTYVGNRLVGEQLIYAPQDAGAIFPTNVATQGFINAPAGLPMMTFGQLTNSPIRQTVHELRLQNEDRVAGLFDYVIGGFMAKAGSTSAPTILVNGTAGSYRPVPLSQTVPVVGGIPTSAIGVGTAIGPNGPFTTYRLDYLAFSSTLRPRIEKESSLFGNLTVHLGESTEVSGGLRHIWWKGDSGTVSGISLLDPTNTGSYAQRACFGSEVLPDLPWSSAAAKAAYSCKPTREATIYMASLKHKFTDDLMAYFSFGTSWRPGNPLVGWGLSQGATPTYGAQAAPFVTPPDETSKSFEVGFKTAWLDRRLRFNVAAFYQKFDNFPIYPNSAVSLRDPNVLDPVTGLSVSPSLVNAFSFVAPAKVTVKGIEADLRFDVSERFNLGATFAFADAKAGSTNVPCTDLNNDNIQDSGTPTAQQLGNHLPAGAQIDTCLINASATNTPRFTGTVQAEYNMPVSDWGEAYLRGFVNWKGASANEATNPLDDVKAYALLDLFAGLRSSNGAWEAGFFVKNLFNTRIVTSRAAAAGVTAVNFPSTGSTGGIPNPAFDAGGVPVAGGTVAGNRGYNYYAISTTDPREFGFSLRYAFGSR